MSRCAEGVVLPVHQALQSFDAILLDVNGTFMFGQDRFGSDQDYGATYRLIGGCGFSDTRVQAVIDACVEHLMLIGRDPTRYGDFPSVEEALDQISEPGTLKPLERGLLAQVIALHELGAVPQAYADTLRELATTHRLGVVSNIWSEKSPWCRVFEAVGVADLFDTIVWSSEARAIKPSPEIFERAIADIGVPRERTIFVGDNPMRDIEGAMAVGLAAVWINDGVQRPPRFEPDLTIRSLLELAEYAA
jgi:HAD superfamily hydrolase (TIGR01509 family)